MELVNRAAFADGGGVDNTEAKIIAVTSIPYFSEATDLDGTDLVDRIADEGIVEEASVSGQLGNPADLRHREARRFPAKQRADAIGDLRHSAH